MLIAVTCFATLIAACSSSVLPDPGSIAVDPAYVITEFKNFKAKFGKVYKSRDEELKRLAIFTQNFNIITAHNDLFSKGQKTYTLGVNQYADQTSEEFGNRNGLIMPNTPYTTNNIFSPILPIPVDLSIPVDWRTQGYVTPVKNQGYCASCWAFSATGALEGQNFRKTNNLVSLSEQNLIDCSSSYGNNGCNGGRMDWAFQYVQNNNGIDSEASYPYEADDNGGCRFNPQAVAATCSLGYQDIPQGNEELLTVAIATVGPISVGIDASQQSFQFYESGIYNDSSCSSTNIDHGVLVVGFGSDTNGQDYYIVKNSWGTGWGEAGYVRMSRDNDNNCGIATLACFPLF